MRSSSATLLGLAITSLSQHCFGTLNAQFPHSAAAPVAMMAAPGAGPAAAAPVVEEKTAFDVVLEEIPADKKVRQAAS